MGLCSSSDLTPEEREKMKLEKEQSKALEQQMLNQHHSDAQVNKLLLLGAGESGKSTLFKQMITIYGKGFTVSDRKNFVPAIYHNIISSMKTLCLQVDALQLSAGLSADSGESKRIINELKGEEEIDEAMANHIKILWADEAIRATYALRAQYQLPDCAQYFFDRVDEICKPGFIPNEQDILRCRVRTTGIVETEFVIDKNQFKMFDVGGQRNERRKWMHCFEKVTAVLFVAAISEFDQVLFEDENTNRMLEAINLFEEICNLRWFISTSIILFLNKRDLFAEKLARVAGGQQVGLRACFPDYSGADTYEASVEFLQDQFLQRNHNPDKIVYHHVTCATDTENVFVVFNAVKDIIIRKSLANSGLV